MEETPKIYRNGDSEGAIDGTASGEGVADLSGVIAPTVGNSSLPSVPRRIVSIPIDEHPVAVYLAGLSPSSRDTMRRALETISRLIGEETVWAVQWDGIRFQHIAALRGVLAETYAPSTANRMLSAMKGVMKAAFRLGLLTSDDYSRAIDIPTVRGERIPAGRELSPDEIRELIGACRKDKGLTGKRDLAMIAVMYAAGLRREEVSRIGVTDIDVREGKIIVRRGKGNKERTVYLSDGAKNAIAIWGRVRGRADGAFFCHIGRGGEPDGKEISPTAIYQMVQRRGSQAGIAKFSPHDLRRTFVGTALEVGVDIGTVRAIAGHSSVNTTARYDRRGEDVKRRAATLIPFPDEKIDA